MPDDLPLPALPAVSLHPCIPTCFLREIPNFRIEEKGLAPSPLNKIRTYLDKDIPPGTWRKPLDDITRTECADLQASIEVRDARNVAEKCRTWVNQIFGRSIG